MRFLNQPARAEGVKERRPSRRRTPLAPLDKDCKIDEEEDEKEKDFTGTMPIAA